MNLALKIAFIERGTRQIEAATALGWDPSKLSKFLMVGGSQIGRKKKHWRVISGNLKQIFFQTPLWRNRERMDKT